MVGGLEVSPSSFMMSRRTDIRYSVSEISVCLLESAIDLDNEGESPQYSSSFGAVLDASIP
jgi:hypothetical protein